jgi:uncharacterized protein (DUF983 family)
MSRRARSRQDRLRVPLTRRLERAADDLNPILVIIVIGLAVLNFSVFTALRLAPPSYHSMMREPASPAVLSAAG